MPRDCLDKEDAGGERKFLVGKGVVGGIKRSRMEGKGHDWER